MSTKNIPRIIIATLGVVIALGMANTIAASNTIPDNHLDEYSLAIGITDKQPGECKMVLTSIIECAGGICQGTNASDLILGSAGLDNINGKNGDDCIVSGDGNDIIDGGAGNDYIMAGEGNDTLSGGNNDDYLVGGNGDDDLNGDKGTDVCIGGLGNDTIDLVRCETISDP